MKRKTSTLIKGIAVSGAIIGGITLINRLITKMSTIKDILYDQESLNYEWRFGSINYVKMGSGTPLLLVHDLSSTGSLYEWKHVIAQLSEKHTVYALDLLGCGASEKPNLTYTNYMYVQLLNDFVKEVIKCKTDIMTSGNASSIAVMACQTDGQLYHRLLFVNPQTMDEMAKMPKPNHKVLKYLIEAPFIGTLIYNIITCKKMVQKSFVKRFYDDPVLIEDEDVEGFVEAAHLGGYGAKFFYASVRSHFTNINVIPALKKMDHSIYILGGSEEPHIDTTIVNYEYWNPAIEHDIVQGTRHLPHMERPVQVAELCEIYLT